MNPYRSNSEKEKCSPTSSNCVIWQGPNLPCINLCKGDTVSDVVYKLAEEVCILKDSIGLSNIELTCLIQVCQTTPEPAKTLTNILELLISKVCCLSDIVNNIPNSGTPYVEPTLNLPACLQYPNGTGGTVTQLLHSQYTLRIATVLCAINTTVNTHTSQINDLQGRVLILENPTNVTPQLTSCLLGTIADVETIVQELESQFCGYKTVLGPTSDITSGIAKQCANLNTEKQLATGFPMTSIVGWKSTVQNLGQAINNIWLTLCDVRNAVKVIQSSCCKVDCNSITIDFDYKWIDATTLRLFFFPKSTLPLGFYDCNDAQGNMVTITDGLGNQYTVYFHFRREDPTDLTGIFDDTNILTNGYDVDLSLSPLDTSTALSMDGNLCFTNGDFSCISCLTKPIAKYINKDCCTITASEAVTITYKTCPALVTTTTTIIPG